MTSEAAVRWRYALPVAALLGFVVLWQVAVRVLGIPELILPAPLKVAASLWRWRDLLLHDTLVTLAEALIGFGTAAGIGIPLAALIAETAFLRQTIYPLLVVAQSVPKVAIAPLVLVWLGFGLLPKVVVAFLVAFFPVVVDTIAGLNSVEPDLLDLMRSLRAGRLQTFVTVLFPSALPHVFAGFKVAVTLSLIGAVIAEFVGATAGLGYIVLVSTSQSNTALTYAALVLLGALGVALFAAVGSVEAVVIPWAYRKPAE